MGLRLISEDELLTYHGDGFKIFYKRVSNARRSRILERHTKRGRETNSIAAGLEMLDLSVVGWEGVYEMNGDGVKVEIPFEIAKIKAIPDDVAGDLMDLIGANADDIVRESKNSKSSSGSKPTTKGSTVSDAG